MGALNSLRPAARGVVDNPVLLVVTGLYGLAQVPQLALQPEEDPMLAAIASLAISGVVLLVFPFFHGGIIGMARDAVTGRTNLSTFIREGKENYVTLLLAYLILIALSFLLGILFIMGILIGGIGLLAGDGGAVGLVGIAALVGVALLVGLVYLLVFFFVQFYGHAIVLDDTGLTDGFRRSVGVVRTNLLSTIGYTLILIVAGSVFGAVSSLATAALTGEELLGVVPSDPSVPMIAGSAVVYVVLIAIAGALWATYSVAFYRDVSASVR